MPACAPPMSALRKARVLTPRAMYSSAARGRRLRRCLLGPRHAVAATVRLTFGLKGWTMLRWAAALLNAEWQHYPLSILCLT